MLHCFYCHGYEVAGQRLGVLATSDRALQTAMLLPDWSEHVTLFTNGVLTLGPEQLAELRTRGVSVEDVPVVGDAPTLSGLRLNDGRITPVDAVFTNPRTRMASPLAEQLGCEFEEGPSGPFIRTGADKQTTVRCVGSLPRGGACHSDAERMRITDSGRNHRDATMCDHPMRTQVNPGDQLDHYRIDEVLAHTTVASVFLGTDLRAQQKVTIKVPHPDVENDPIFSERFRREEEIGRSLDHPGLTKVFSDGAHSRPYIAMEWFDGQLLRNLLNEKKKLPVERAGRILLGLTDMLDYVENHGVVIGTCDRRTSWSTATTTSSSSTSETLPRPERAGLRLQISLRPWACLNTSLPKS